MIIALLNFSGSVGKTTAAANLLAPRMNAPIFAIESTNESASDLGLDVETLRGAKFADLYRELILHTDAIIDVGASNVEAFLTAMTKQEGSHARIDRFLIPCLPNPKAQRETIKTIKALTALGVPYAKIRVLFNQVEDTIREDFDLLFRYFDTDWEFIVDEKIAMDSSDVYPMLSNIKTTVSALLSDPADYLELARAEPDKAKARELSNRLFARELAQGVNCKLDAAYSALMAA